ncbi:Cytochrome P450-SU2 [Pseudonocardia autotrophica]|nr:Cytochrome P450-SU2 [Pseudonocardia autotrophica]
MTAPIPEFPLPRAAGCPFDPPPELLGLHARGPVGRVRIWDGSTPWFVTGHALQRELLSDPRVSADPTNDGYPHVTAGIKARHADARSFITMDDPEHRRLRRMLTSPFAVRRVEALRPTIRRIVDERIDAILDGPRPVDLVAAFALPVPTMVICELLGVPYADHEFFQRSSHVLIHRYSTVEQVLAAQRGLVGYLEDLIARRLTDPAEDILSRMAARHVATGELTSSELASMLLLILVAGHETTANMIALGTLALLGHPEQLAALRTTGDPALVVGATEELLRYLPIVHSVRRRVALADIALPDGTTIRAGDGIVLPNDVGNRDPEAFPDAERLDIRRDARHHVAFGFGPHQCLGQPLVRVELQVVYGTLYRRIPTLRLAVEPSEVRFKHDGLIYGVHDLPVTW